MPPQYSCDTLASFHPIENDINNTQRYHLVGATCWANCLCDWGESVHSLLELGAQKRGQDNRCPRKKLMHAEGCRCVCFVTFQASSGVRGISFESSPPKNSPMRKPLSRSSAAGCAYQKHWSGATEARRSCIAIGCTTSPMLPGKRLVRVGNRGECAMFGMPSQIGLATLAKQSFCRALFRKRCCC